MSDPKPGSWRARQLEKGEARMERLKATDAERKQAAADAKAFRREGQAEDTFAKSPPGKARRARTAGQRYFQVELDIENVDRTGLAKLGHEMTTAVRSTSDGVGAMLTAIEDEGWELVTAGFTFRPTHAASRDKALVSGQQIAISGQTVGVYLFRLREEASP